MEAGEWIERLGAPTPVALPVPACWAGGALELHPIPRTPGRFTLVVEGGPRLLGVVETAVLGRAFAPHLALRLNGAPSDPLVGPAMEALLAWLGEATAAQGWRREVVARATLDREVLRRSGLSLAGDRLWIDGPGRSPEARPPFDDLAAARAHLADVLGQAVGVELRPGGDHLLRRVRTVDDVLVLRGRDEVGPVSVALPRRLPLSVGRLVAAVEAFLRLRRRFPWAAMHQLACVSPNARKQGSPAGWHHPSETRIYLHSDIVEVHPADLSSLEPLWLASPQRVPEVPPAPWEVEVVAHEAWHRAEAALEVFRYRSWAAISIGVGEVLGVRSLGHLFHEQGPGRDEAMARLERAVGTYATTSVKEATAQLFAHWWMGRRGEPLVDHFGELLERHAGVRV